MRKGLLLSCCPKRTEASIFGTLVSPSGRVYITAIAAEILFERYNLFTIQGASAITQRR